MKEEWRKIHGFEVYEISNFGNIRRITKHRGVKYLKAEITRLGYIRIRLCMEGKVRRCLIHTLVMESFSKKPNWATEINHIDGNKANNHIKNLEWSTRSKNVSHAFKIGACKKIYGENNSSSKLTLDQVIEIKKELKTPYHGINVRLGKKYNVTPEAISAIKHNKNWANIKLDVC